VDVTGHLNKLNKELRGKDKLICDMNVNIKAFIIKLQLWENQLKTALKYVGVPFSEHIQDYSQSIFYLRRVLRNASRLQNYGTRIFVVCFTLQTLRILQKICKCN
jgi:hypothetical protein